MQAEEKALAAFDDAAGGSCDAQRKALQEAIRKAMPGGGRLGLWDHGGSGNW